VTVECVPAAPRQGIVVVPSAVIAPSVCVPPHAKPPPEVPPEIGHVVKIGSEPVTPSTQFPVVPTSETIAPDPSATITPCAVGFETPVPPPSGVKIVVPAMMRTTVIATSAIIPTACKKSFVFLPIRFPSYVQ
jgi:hypothetical protein